jgi:hypothetical protein
MEDSESDYMNDGTISRGGGRTRKLVREIYKNRRGLRKRASMLRRKRITYRRMRGGNAIITSNSVTVNEEGGAAIKRPTTRTTTRTPTTRTPTTRTPTTRTPTTRTPPPTKTPTTKTPTTRTPTTKTPTTKTPTTKTPTTKTPTTKTPTKDKDKSGGPVITGGPGLGPGSGQSRSTTTPTGSPDESTVAKQIPMTQAALKGCNEAIKGFFEYASDPFPK